MRCLTGWRYSSALHMARHINEYNEQRKDIDKQMTEEANGIVSRLDTLEIILVLTEFNYKSKCKKDSESTFLKKGGFIMKSSKKTYQEVAEACSKYEPVSEESAFKNSSCECSTPSCLNCTHFTKQEHCDLDLYDQIVEKIK